MHQSISGSRGNPVPARPPAPQGAKPRSNALYRWGGIAAGVVLVASAAIFYFARRIPGEPPRLNGPVEELASFADSSAFQKMPFDRQVLYLKAMDERESDFEQAYEQRRIDAEEYKAVLEYAWFGKQLDRMEKYQSLRGEARTRYLDKLLDKKIDDKKKPNKPAAPARNDLPKVKRDESSEKTYPMVWPADAQRQWEQFRKALKDREKELTKAGQEKLTAPASKPV